MFVWGAAQTWLDVAGDLGEDDDGERRRRRENDVECDDDDDDDDEGLSPVRSSALRRLRLRLDSPLRPPVGQSAPRRSQATANSTELPPLQGVLFLSAVSATPPGFGLFGGV